MKRMHRMPTRKPHSWWWDSHISPKNSKWLAENLEEMDKQVKEMLRLLEEEGESFAKKAEMYYQRRPLLVNHVENFYRMYRALAERYDNVTGELRKNIPSSLQSQRSSGISESDSETQSPSPSPEPDLEQKTPRQKRKPRPAGFDSLLGSGGSSDISKKGSDGSSSSSESDSEPDEAKEEDGNSISYALNQRIIELEDELHEATEKLEALEEKTMHCQCEFGANGNASVLNSKFSELEEKLQASRVEINELHKDLEERSQSSKSFAEVNSEKEALQAAVLANKNEIESLKGAMASASKQYESQLAHRDLEVEKCKQELEQVSENYLCDKFTLEAEITKLQEVIKKFEGDLAKMSQEKLQLESRVKELEQATRSLDDSSAEIMKLKEVIKDLQEGLGNVSNEKEVLQEKIKNLEAELESALKEKSLLEDRVKDLEQVTHELNASVTHSLEKFSLEKSSLSAEVLNLSEANASLEDKLALVEAQLKHVHAEKAEASWESEKQISELNQILANLNSKLELLSSEKAVVDNKVATLLTEITTRDEKMSQMESHLHQLHLEHAKLLAEIDMAQKAVSELRAQVHELEEEVEKQKLVISDSAEGKREAIRQLCFSLEHYRDGYQQLRQLLQCHRRPMVMAT